MHGLNHSSLNLLEFSTLQIGYCTHHISKTYPKTWVHIIYLVLVCVSSIFTKKIVVHIQKHEECISTTLKKNFRVLVKEIPWTEPTLLTLWKIMNIFPTSCRNFEQNHILFKNLMLELTESHWWFWPSFASIDDEAPTHPDSPHRL